MRVEITRPLEDFDIISHLDGFEERVVSLMVQPIGTILVTAGAYVGTELAAEFGRLPPAFLPVGNKRLFTHQAEKLGGEFARRLISVPDDFDIQNADLRLLEQADLELVRVPRGLSLTGSILHAIAEAGVDSGPFAVLHGDTLIFDIDYAVPDSVSVADTSESYEWAGGRVENGAITSVFDVPQGVEHDGPILSGFFHFADINLLILSLAASGGRFVNALDRYARRRPLKPLSSRRWLDFGHLHTYYISRGSITTERAFNSLRVEARSVIKQSSKADRIDAESHWYETVPADLRIYLPQYLGQIASEGGTGYGLEFLYMSSLADLLVFGLLTEATWLRIMSSCDRFLRAAGRHAAPEGSVPDPMAMYLPKTLKRLEEYAAESGLDLEQGWTINGEQVPGLVAIARESAGWIAPPELHHLTVVHGDPCFSNILYDFRSQSVRVIDPRGQDAEGRATIWGDHRYDLAKLHHSAVGLYDLIIAGYFRLEAPEPYVFDLEFPDTPSIAAAAAAYDRVVLGPRGADRKAVAAISLHLFLSMLPLHRDSPSRQQAMVANALRLYAAQR